MNLLIVANNIEGNIDGIGKHARMLTSEFERQGHSVQLLSARSGFNKWLSLVTPAMCFVFCRAMIEVVKKNVDYVVVEYPFKEHNPLIVVFHSLLFVLTRFRKTKIAFSMHEYDRVNILRKRVIDVFLKLSDVVFVSEDKYLNRFHSISSKIFLRTIPNHIQCDYQDKPYSPSSFCYFGLVNASKAFREMLEAWKIFNKDRDCFLHIISSTNLSEWDLDSYKGVLYHFNLSAKEVVDVMFNCSFCIVPVQPNIGLNNSSFVSAIQCGCIPIGHFSEVLKKENFVIHVDNYNVDTLHDAYTKVSNMDEKLVKVKSQECRMFGKEFSLEKTANQMIEALGKI